MVAFKGVSKTYNFLHLSIQEFLAAQELARRPLYEQYWLFKGLMDEDRCLPMLTFYAAKTKLSAPGVADFVSNVGDGYLQARNEHEKEQLCGLLAFVIKCICETEDPELCKPLVKALGENICSLSHIYDYYSLGSFLSLSTCTSLGHENRIMIGTLKRSTIQDNEWALFIKGLLRFSRGKCVSQLETTTLSVDISDPILGLLCNTEILCVPHIIFQSESVANMKKVRRIRRHSSVILSASEEKLFEHSLNRLYSLDTSIHRNCQNLLKQNCTISCIELRKITGCCKFIAEGLLSNTTLHEIRFSECSISSEEFQCLSDALCRNEFVRILDIFGCHLSEAAAQNISDIFQFNVTLEELKLQSCGISSHHLSLITSFGQLKTLVLSLNLFGNKGAKCLSKILRDSKILQKLVLTDCGITEKSSTFLLQVFQRGMLKCLNTLDASNKHIHSRRAVLYSRFQHGNLESIPFFNNESSLQISVDDDVGKALERFIKHNYPCHSLVLCSKTLDFSVINNIFEALKKIQCFYIKTSFLNDTNLKAIAESLQENQSLTAVLVDCRLTEQDSTSTIPSLTPKIFRYPISQVIQPSYTSEYTPVVQRYWDDHLRSQVNTLYEYMIRCLRSNVSLKYLLLPVNCDASFFRHRLHNVTVTSDMRYLYTDYYDSDDHYTYVQPFLGGTLSTLRGDHHNDSD